MLGVEPPIPRSFRPEPSHYTDYAAPTPELRMRALKCRSFLFCKTLAVDGLLQVDMSSEEITAVVYVLGN